MARHAPTSLWFLAVVACALATPACGRSSLDAGPELDAGAEDAGEEQDAGPILIETTDKVDLLFVVDNSRNLGLAHSLLADTSAALLERFARPVCVNGLGNVVATTQLPDDPCPVGQREFRPIDDVHIGVISTSLGGHGADVCSPASPTFDPDMNDAAHLLTRDGSGGFVPTYGDRGFLAWDPLQQKSPPGEGDLGALKVKLHDLVGGVGQRGCGFESQLESIYRFLVDPAPYQTITTNASGSAQLSGVDEVVLQQRADFLRPDSAVAIVLLTDENDCSTREGGQYYLSNQGLAPGGVFYHLPRARSICATSPNDPCCASCAQNTPAGCSPTSADPSCLLPPYDVNEDPINLRCFDQKRRFGIDFLYPIDRYVKALTEATIADRQGNLVANPLFVGQRSPRLVMLAGIVGVPWQDVATDPNSLATGFAPASQINWRPIIGDPASLAPPEDPLMRESIDPRVGTNPATGLDLAPPESTVALANPINGHERSIPFRDDLQFTCIYPVPIPITCTDSTCECDIDTKQQGNPLCQASDGTYSAVQRFEGARPSLRPLVLLHDLGEQAVVGSVCADVVTGESQPTFGYKPLVDGLLRSLRERLE